MTVKFQNSEISNFCNGNTIDNEENLISCSHGGRCVYKTDDNINVSVVVDRFKEKNLIPLMIYALSQMIQFGSQIHHMVFYLITKGIKGSKNMKDVMYLDLILIQKN